MDQLGATGATSARNLSSTQNFNFSFPANVERLGMKAAAAMKQKSIVVADPRQHNKLHSTFGTMSVTNTFGSPIKKKKKNKSISPPKVPL